MKIIYIACVAFFVIGCENKADVETNYKIGIQGYKVDDHIMCYVLNNNAISCVTTR